MFIYRPEQNIFDTNAELIINPTNTVGIMGKGLALAFKKKYPQMFEEYKTACRTKKHDIGKNFYYKTNDNTICCLATKKHWRDNSQYPYIDKGLYDLAEYIKNNNIKSVAIPKLGCGLGNLKWSIVVGSIRFYLKDLDCEIFILGEEV